jgi:hypothetical protein
MSHFSLKSLAFYGVAISSVVVLFKVVSAYGEANLRAPLLMDGSYRFSAENLPGCLKSDALVLNIKQSGTYVFGTLLPATAEEKTVTSAAQKPSLAGRLNNQQLTLAGALPHLASCNSDQASSRVRIQGTLEKDTLTGKIRLSSIPTLAEFTATKEATAKKSEREP